MPHKRKRKEYKHGERINIYLKNDIPQEMLNWINNQTDITMFFLYAAEQLYSKTGGIDIATILPRKYDFKLGDIVNSSVENNIIFSKETTPDKEIKAEENINNDNNQSWESLEDLEDDPYA